MRADSQEVIVEESFRKAYLRSLKPKQLKKVSEKLTCLV